MQLTAQLLGNLLVDKVAHLLLAARVEGLRARRAGIKMRVGRGGRS
jgi:hypothetical protein